MVEYIDEVITEKDIVIIQPDLEIIDLETASNMYNQLQKIFSKNEMMMIPQGIDISVIRKDYQPKKVNYKEI